MKNFPLCLHDVLFWIKDKHEVEKVDFYLQIKEKLVSVFALCSFPKTLFWVP